jgi:hypothetical protein
MVSLQTFSTTSFILLLADDRGDFPKQTQSRRKQNIIQHPAVSTF